MTTATPLTEPREDVPPVIEDEAALDEAIRLIAAGTGPVAIDTERASGYKYSQRAYLVQLRRKGAGTMLIDPIATPYLDRLGETIADAEWILHAASQDLSCLAEIGMKPARIFDSEVAGRLLGFERVSLGAMLEACLDVILAKEHSAADWSTRPLPAPWLTYAALDVEMLIELRENLVLQLEAAGKLEWAEQEFQATLDAPPPLPRAEPWRRVSGVHAARSRRALAEVRALWETRDGIARQRDIAAGRILPDRAIMNAVASAPSTKSDLLSLPVFSGPRMRRQVDVWWRALCDARALPDADLPQLSPARGDGPPSGRWNDRDPQAAARLAAVRIALATLAEQQTIQVESLLEPAVVRRVAWYDPPDLVSYLTESRVRPWQIELTAEVLAVAMATAADTAGGVPLEPEDD